jgi:asparagine synthase (glutamine-hydrolysing)
MCGIVGIFDMTGQGRSDRNALTRMTAALSHRGPDAYNYFLDDRLVFGFQRLSIIDLEHGLQPFVNEDQSVISICNGEIFNFKDLRHELEEKGHEFHTRCDTEVLPHLYEEYGTTFINKLNGQFAFAIYDRKRNHLILARDHFGIVPLFYTITGGIFLFASEIKALLEHPVVTREVNLAGLDQVLCFPGLVSPTTMFANIKSLESGTALIVSPDSVEVHEYWDLIYPPANVSSGGYNEDYYIEGLREHLRRSVRQRLMSDVPVGLYLSGGLDSSVIAALACAAQPGDHFHSFSVSFKGKEMCEGRYQRLMAQVLKTIHHEISFGPNEVLDRLAKTIYHTECPIRETYDTACLALSEVAKQNGVSVVTTGQGADELFGGYIGYRFDDFHSRRQRIGEREQREQTIRERLWGDPMFAYDGNYTSLEELKHNLYSEYVKERLPEFDCLLSSPIKKERLVGRHILHRRSYIDFKLRLADHLLGDHGDRMAMANAVEARHPFLDVELVKFVSEIPPRMKLNDLVEKYVLREAARTIVPKDILEREKFAWFAPGSPELVLSSNEWISNLLSPETIKRQGYFNADTVNQLHTQYRHRDFTLNHPFELDILTIVVSFTAFVEIFRMPYLGQAA